MIQDVATHINDPFSSKHTNNRGLTLNIILEISSRKHSNSSSIILHSPPLWVRLFQDLDYISPINRELAFVLCSIEKQGSSLEFVYRNAENKMIAMRCSIRIDDAFLRKEACKLTYLAPAGCML